MPVNKPVIKSLTVETFGVDYGDPETVEPFDYQSYINQMYGLSGNSASSTITSEEDVTDDTSVSENE